MEAFSPTRSALAGLLTALVIGQSVASSAEFRTRNFVVTAATTEVAQQVAETAEQCRRDLAMEWLGKEIPNWFRPCPVKVTVGQIGAGGATTFTFDRGEVSGWNMRVQGSLERVLDSVIPHEVSHTIFASHFRRPLPRWADEGAATLIEHATERKRQDVLLERVIHTTQRIPLDKLLAMSEYPSDMQQVYTLYAEGYSLANFLVQQHGPDGKAVFLQFIQDAHKHGWVNAIKQHYDFASIGSLEQEWTGWVLAGSPARHRPEGESLAAAAPNSGGDSTGDRPLDRTVALADAATTSQELPPLPPLARALRPDRETGDRTAAAPVSSIQEAAASRGAEGRLADSGRVLPRIDRFPGHDPAASNRLAQLRREMSATDQRARQISTGRTGEANGDPVLRAQSPETRHWGQFSAFADRQTQGASTATGRSAPFSR